MAARRGRRPRRPRPRSTKPSYSGALYGTPIARNRPGSLVASLRRLSFASATYAVPSASVTAVIPVYPDQDCQRTACRPSLTSGSLERCEHRQTQSRCDRLPVTSNQRSPSRDFCFPLREDFAFQNLLRHGVWQEMRRSEQATRRRARRTRKWSAARGHENAYGLIP